MTQFHGIVKTSHLSDILICINKLINMSTELIERNIHIIISNFLSLVNSLLDNIQSSAETRELYIS